VFLTEVVNTFYPDFKGWTTFNFEFFESCRTKSRMFSLLSPQKCIDKVEARSVLLLAVAGARVSVEYNTSFKFVDTQGLVELWNGGIQKRRGLAHPYAGRYVKMWS
jgi:hypothetical protein